MEVGKWTEISLAWFIPSAQREVHAAVFSSVRGAILRGFFPTQATCCTDGGDIWHGGVLLHTKYHPQSLISVGTRDRPK